MKKSDKSSSMKINGIKIEDMKTTYLIKQINLLSVASIFGVLSGCLGVLMYLTGGEAFIWAVAILPLMVLPVLVNAKRIKAMKNELKSRDVSAAFNSFLTKNFKQTIALYILGGVAIISAMLGILGICAEDIFDNAILTAGLIVTAIVCGILFYAVLEKSKKEEISLKTDKELISEFKECATYIQTRAEVASGLKGVGSRTATSSVNNKIAKKRETGQLIAKELTSRGYKVDTSVLMRNAVKAKSNNDLLKIIGGAVVGSVVAGGAGAVVGAVAAKNKIDNQKK